MVSGGGGIRMGTYLVAWHCSNAIIADIRLDNKLLSVTNAQAYCITALDIISN